MEETDGASLGPSCFELTEADLHIWTIELKGSDRVVEECHSLLSDEETARADRLFHEEHRRKYTLSHGVLRALLGNYLSVSPASIQYKFGHARKPFLADCQATLQFNVSDSGDLALIGFAQSCDLGVDVEFVKRMADMEAVARRFFSPEERSELQSLDEPERTTAFFRCWTRKEAYLKALGDGLAAPLDSFQVTLRPDEEPRLVQTELAGGNTRNWHLHHLAPALDYLGAVAYTGQPRRIREWPLVQPDDLVR